MLKTVDWKLSVQLANNNADTAQELLDMMRDELPQAKQLLIASFQAQDAKRLASEAHKLHGGCCYCGLPKLKELIRSLEIAAKEQPPILDSELFDMTMAEIDQVIESLNRRDYR
ncbi:MAG TPA: Hpt domain-containing protein [Coxiellaceae bacterium]|nr:Hpt domain-containing protein [Coxiellaceae bacterium]